MNSLNETIIDIHCHILPNLDDGPSSVEEAQKMLEKAKEIGITEIVATPHLIWQGEIISKDKIKEAIGLLSPKIRIYIGAETPLLEAPNLLENGQLIPTGRVILLDTPTIGSLAGLEQLIFKLHLKRFIPVLAHPERNLALARDRNRLEHLRNMGLLFQINGSSLLGALGKEVKKSAEKLLEWSFVDIIASDSHSPEGMENYRDALLLLRKRWGEQLFRKLTKGNIIKLLKEAREVEQRI